MMFIKFWGAYQQLPYSVLEFRLLQCFFFLKLIVYYILWLIGIVIWPFYLFWRIWRHLKYKEPFDPQKGTYGDDSSAGWLPFGVRGGLILNLIAFAGLYIGCVYWGYSSAENDYKKHNAPTEQRVDFNVEYYN